MGNSHPTVRTDILRALAEAGGASDWITAPQVVRHARSNGEELNSSTVYRALTRMRREVEYRTAGHVRRFHLRRQGRDFLTEPLQDTGSFVSPNTPWTTRKHLKKAFDGLSGEIFIVDPYISEDSLDLFSESGARVSILTTRLGRTSKEEEFMRAAKKLSREKGGLLEIRRCSAEKLHGRYVFTSVGAWVVDHSLQDLGVKPALILQINSSLVAKVRSHFETIFSDALLVL
jgi:hypothetical protein